MTAITWRQVLWAGPLAISLGLPTAGLSQEAEFSGIEEIVVTARKREETLQDVPLPVTAITADQIALTGIKDVEDAIQMDASLNFDTGFAPYDTRIVIRGLSPTRGRPNVATLVDGVDISSEAIGVAGGSLLINPKLLDVQRIEVVKGPQSALYGRSAFAGAVQYITKDPSQEASGDFSVSGGSDNFEEYRAEFSAPLINDILGFRVTGLKYQEDGFYRNQTTGNLLGGSEGEGAALSLKFTPNDSLDFKLRYEYSHDRFEQSAQANVGFNTTNAVSPQASKCVAGGFVNDQSCQFLPVLPSSPPGTPPATNNAWTLAHLQPGGAVNPNVLGPLSGIFDDMTIPAFRGSLGDAGDRTVRYSPDWSRSTDGRTGPDFPGSDRNVNRVSLVANWNTSFGTFTSLTGYTDANVFTSIDLDKFAVLDANGYDVSGIQQGLTTDADTYQTSQELRFTSDFDGPVNFVAGLQYWEEKVSQGESNYTAVAAGTRCQINGMTGLELGPGVCGGSGMGVFPDPANAIQSVTTSGAVRGVGQYIDSVLAAKPAVLFTDRETDHQSAYLQVGWNITDAWSLSLEGRYVDEDNSVTGPDPQEVTGAPFADAPTSGPGTVILCGSNGPCVAGPPPICSQPPGGAPFSCTGRGLPNGSRGFGTPPSTYVTFERNDSYVTPRFSTDYRITDNAMVFASYSQARKPGGFSTVTIGAFGLNSRPDVEFDPEKLKQYEIGFKSSWLDRRLIVNGAAFYIDFTDKQVSTQEIRGTILGNVIKNAGGAEIKGLELSAQFQPIRQLTFSGSYTYLDSEYTDYTVTTGGAPEISRVGNCVIGYVDPISDEFIPGLSPAPVPPATTPFGQTCQVTRNGNQMEDTPEHAFAGQITWRDAIGSTGFDYFVDLAGRWQDKRFLEDDNTAWADSYWLADLRLGVQSDNWTVIGFIDNVMDDDTIKGGGTGPGNANADFRFGQVAGQGGPIAAPLIPTMVFANLPDPRTYRLQIGYRF